MASDAVADAMSLCVSCKACKRECPTGVDMAKMKIEALASRFDRNGLTRRDWLIAELPRYAKLVAPFAPLANLRNKLPLLRRLGERVAGLAAARPLPAWRRDAFRDSEAAAFTPTSPRGDVILLADTFNRWFEPENLRAAVRVLTAAGYRVRLPEVHGHPVCCGRTYLSVGMVDKARSEARRTLDALAGDLPVIGLEPSCLLTLRDEYRSLLPGAAADSLADRALLLGEFLAREKPALPLKHLPATAHVHGHCHQKSFGAFVSALDVLKQVPDLSVKPIASSCCGMAGSFGYQAETQAESRAMAEAGLLPAVRAAAAEDIVVADGTSCRHQIRDLAGREAIHSVRLLERALE
jgi:Fe-S oxidoreductase